MGRNIDTTVKDVERDTTSSLNLVLFLGRLITETKMPPTVKGLFQCRVDDFFNSSLTSIGVLPSTCDAHVNMTCFIISSFGIVIRHSPLTRSGNPL